MLSRKPTQGLWNHFVHLVHSTKFPYANWRNLQRHQISILIESALGTVMMPCGLGTLIVGKGAKDSLSMHFCKCVRIFDWRHLIFTGLSPDAIARQTAATKTPQSAPPRCCCIGITLTLRTGSLVAYKSASYISSSSLVRPE